MSDASGSDDTGLDLRAAISGAIDTNTATEQSGVQQATIPDKAIETIAEDKPDAVQTPEKETPQPQEKPIEPHANWSKEAKDNFAKLDKQSQTFLLDREKSMQADYTRKTQEIAALKRDYEPVDKLFTPYKDQMKASGQTPHSLIEGWANVEKALMNGKGVDVIRGIIQGYKLNPQDIISALSPSQRQQPAAGTPPIQPQAAFQLPPEIAAKLQKIDQFESRFAADDKARVNAEIAKVSQSIEDFKSEKDGSGNALHPHFDELEQDMAVLAQVMKVQGKTPALSDLYEKAVYANPSTREKVLAAVKQADEKRVKDEARAKAEKARKASSSVTGGPSNGSGQPLTNGRDNSVSLRDQIAQSYSEVAS